MSTTAIFGSYVLSRQDGVQTVLRDHWVLVEGNRIAAVTPSRPTADRVLDRPGRFVLPGLLNLHNHCFSEAIARTLTEDDGGRRGTEHMIYALLLPLSRRGIEILAPSERLDIARLGILQLLKGGATTVMESFRNGIPEMFDAAEEMGIRFYGAPFLLSQPDARMGADGRVDYGADQGDADLHVFERLHGRWHGQAEGRIRLVMSPHATDSCGPDLLRAAASRARVLGIPITTHLAQSRGEVATIGSRHAGRSPAEYLDWLGILGPDLLAAHCICCTDDDLRLMAARRMTVINCPRTFARAGTMANWSRFSGFGLRTLVATDGYDMDLLAEVGMAATLSKLSAGRADIASAPEMIDAVTSDAAAAIQRPDLGEIRPGATADLTVVNLLHPHLQPLVDPRRALVALGNRANVDLVVVNGRVLLEGGTFQGMDESALVSAGVAAIQKIWQLPEADEAIRQ